MGVIYENFFLETEEHGRKNLVECNEISGVECKTMYSRLRSRNKGANDWTDHQIMFTPYLGNGGRRKSVVKKLSPEKQKEQDMFNERSKFLRRRLCW